jgi:hypothetical protein
MMVETLWLKPLCFGYLAMGLIKLDLSSKFSLFGAIMREQVHGTILSSI